MNVIMIYDEPLYFSGDIFTFLPVLFYGWDSGRHFHTEGVLASRFKNTFR